MSNNSKVTAGWNQNWDSNIWDFDTRRWNILKITQNKAQNVFFRYFELVFRNSNGFLNCRLETLGSEFNHLKFEFSKSDKCNRCIVTSLIRLQNFRTICRKTKKLYTENCYVDDAQIVCMYLRRFVELDFIFWRTFVSKIFFSFKSHIIHVILPKNYTEALLGALDTYIRKNTIFVIYSLFVLSVTVGCHISVKPCVMWIFRRFLPSEGDFTIYHHCSSVSA